MTSPGAPLNSAVLDWDIDNHLVSFTKDGVTTNFTYDALGRRLEKLNPAKNTLYISAGQQVVEEYEVVGAGSYSLARSYVYGSYIDDVVAKIEAVNTPTVLYYHSDRQFNVRALTDDATTPVVRELYAYSPYGKQIILDASGTQKLTTDYSNPYGFTGRRLDAETGLWYFRARYLDSELGRFISRDPLGYVDGMSLYKGYFAQSFGLDPFGMNRVNKAKALAKANKSSSSAGAGGPSVKEMVKAIYNCYKTVECSSVKSLGQGAWDLIKFASSVGRYVGPAGMVNMVRDVPAFVEQADAMATGLAALYEFSKQKGANATLQKLMPNVWKVLNLKIGSPEWCDALGNLKGQVALEVILAIGTAGLGTAAKAGKYGDEVAEILTELEETSRKLYRGMKEGPNGQPLLEESARGLGVRPGTDLDIIDNMAISNEKGISVAPDDPMNLKDFRRPPEYNGTGKDPVWEIDTKDLPSGLEFFQDSPTHGVLRPDQNMPYEGFQKLLEETLPFWKRK